MCGALAVYTQQQAGVRARVRVRVFDVAGKLCWHGAAKQHTYALCIRRVLNACTHSSSSRTYLYTTANVVREDFCMHACVRVWQTNQPFKCAFVCVYKLLRTRMAVDRRMVLWYGVRLLLLCSTQRDLARE